MCDCRISIRCIKRIILAAMKKLVPGAASHLNAIRLPDGRVSSDPKEMANALTLHWGKVFAHKSINNQNLGRWLRKSRLSLPSDPNAWEVKPEHVENAIKYSNNSAPGPDGIPYSFGASCPPAWSRCIFD